MKNVFKMMKQVHSMQSEMKQIEKSLAQKTAEYSSGGVTVVAKGDMTIQSVKIAPDAVDTSRMDRLEKHMVSAVNGALANAKKMAGSEVSKLAGTMGLGDLLGGG
jgi:DNA-binding YbaB/EbfC family protein